MSFYEMAPIAMAFAPLVTFQLARKVIEKVITPKQTTKPPQLQDNKPQGPQEDQSMHSDRAEEEEDYESSESEYDDIFAKGVIEVYKPFSATRRQANGDPILNDSEYPVAPATPRASSPYTNRQMALTKNLKSNGEKLKQTNFNPVKTRWQCQQEKNQSSPLTKHLAPRSITKSKNDQKFGKIPNFTSRQSRLEILQDQIKLKKVMTQVVTSATENENESQMSLTDAQEQIQSTSRWALYKQAQAIRKPLRRGGLVVESRLSTQNSMQ